MLLKTHRVNIMMTDVLVKKKMARAVWDLGLKVKRVSGRKTGRRDVREMLHSSWKKSWKFNGKQIYFVLDFFFFRWVWGLIASV